MASLVVGLNDVVRLGARPIREDILHRAGTLAREGALIITVRFHDHTRVLGLPRLLAGPLRPRIKVLIERSFGK